MKLVHRGGQFPLGDVLDIFVQGQDQVLSRLRRAAGAAQPVLLGIGFNQQLARPAPNGLFVAQLHAGQPVVVHAYVAEHVRRQLPLGIKPLVFLLGVDALQIQLADAGRFPVGDLALDPTEEPVSLELPPQIPFPHVQHRRQKLGGGFGIGNLAGNRENRVHLHAHRQRVEVAVVNNAPHRAHFDGAFLLAAGLVAQGSVC